MEGEFVYLPQLGTSRAHKGNQDLIPLLPGLGGVIVRNFPLCIDPFRCYRVVGLVNELVQYLLPFQGISSEETLVMVVVFDS